jgi:hypothetical protein
VAVFVRVWKDGEGAWRCRGQPKEVKLAAQVSTGRYRVYSTASSGVSC